MLRILLISLFLVGCSEPTYLEYRVKCVDEDGKLWKTNWVYLIHLNRGVIHIYNSKKDWRNDTEYIRKIKPGEVCRRQSKVVTNE